MKRISGFTLIEIVIVLVLLGILSTITAPLLLKSAEAANISGDTSNVLSQGRLALTRMSRELRNMRSISSSDLTMAASQIVFTMVDGTAITYSYSGGNVLRNSQTLTPANSLSFAYYDANGAVTAVNANVRYITVSFSITENSSTEDFVSTVYLRNS
jgi:prepilin-type N-terminal cleavage/methylation domain-containing protein